MSGEIKKDLKSSAFGLRAIASLIWPQIAPHKKWLWIVLFATPIGVACQTLTPLILKQTIDGPLTTGEAGDLSQYCALFFGVVLSAFLFNSLGVYALQMVGLRSLAGLREQLFTHVLNQGQSFFDQRTTGSLMTRTTSDVDAIGESLTRGVVALISDALLIVGTLGMLLWLNPVLTLVSFSISPLLIWIVNLCRKQLRILFTGIREALSDLNGLFAEYINGVSETQRYRANRVAEERFDLHSARFKDLYHRANWWDAGLYAVMDGLSALSVGLVIAFIAYHAMEWRGDGLMDGVTVGLLVAFIDALNRVYVPIREFSGRLASIQRAFAAIDRILTLTQTHEEISEGDEVLGDVRGEICFKDVSFGYKEAGEDVLRGVSFIVKPGEVVALVGSTGSGKSTIARLLARQYQGYRGKITLDGISLDSLRLSSLRQALVLIGQDPYLFKASIRENIHLWDPVLKNLPTQVEKAAELACAQSFIQKLPNGFESICAAQGEDLSVGQRQLITIARAFARQSPIVILDEATASVDALTENLIDTATAHLFEHKTVLVIAHRLSTITKADRIIMLSRGQIVEQGTHDELLEAGGAYADLVRVEMTSRPE